MAERQSYIVRETAFAPHPPLSLNVSRKVVSRSGTRRKCRDSSIGLCCVCRYEDQTHAVCGERQGPGFAARRSEGLPCLTPPDGTPSASPGPSPAGLVAHGQLFPSACKRSVCTTCFICACEWCYGSCRVHASATTGSIAGQDAHSRFLTDLVDSNIQHRCRNKRR